MDKIKRFIECYIPITICNMKCEYCYVIQENRRAEQKAVFQYTPEQMGRALTQERLGGICYFNLCGLGETLIPPEMTEIVKQILLQGHYLNITTNGTITKRIDEILALPPADLERVHFSFSFHYLELLKLELLETFVANVKKVQASPCSFTLQLNLYDGYLPVLDEIKALSLREFGAWPQVALTRDEEKSQLEILTSLSKEDYMKAGDTFQSPLFKFTKQNFMVKRKEFCYAGEWSFILDMGTGMIKKCYAEEETQNIFADVNAPIHFTAVGPHCNSPYCVNSSHFMSLGVIPSLSTPTYAALRNRAEGAWYSKTMLAFLSSKFSESNPLYSRAQKSKLALQSFPRQAMRLARKFVPRNLKKTIKKLIGGQHS